MKLDDLHVKLYIDSSELDEAIKKADILKEKLETLGILKNIEVKKENKTDE